MGKHTAGPWKVGRTIATTGVMPIKSGHSLIAHVTHPKWGYEDTPQDESECLANAALISSAPELLQALEGAQKALRVALPFLPADKEAHFVGEWLDAVNAAINKAKGQ